MQTEMDLEDDGADPARARLTVAMHALNGRCGKGTVHPASTGIKTSAANGA